MSKSLFREEALNHQHNAIEGETILANSFSSIAISLIALTLAIFLILFCYWGEFSKKERVKGYLIPNLGIIKINSQMPGIIIESYIEEGMYVSKGSPLFSVSREITESTGVLSKAEVINRINQKIANIELSLIKLEEVYQLEQINRKKELAALNSEQKKIENNLLMMKKRAEIAQNSVSRNFKLHEQGFISSDTLEEKEKTLFDVKSNLQVAEIDLIRVKTKIEKHEREKTANKLKTEIRKTDLQQEKISLIQTLAEKETQREFIVTAPSDGEVTGIMFNIGQSVYGQEPLLSLIPKGSYLKAELLLPSKAIGFIKEKQRVLLRYEAYPHQRFGTYGGTISKIAKNIILPNEKSFPIQLQEAAYRVSVDLDSRNVNAYNKILPLKSGMILEADIKLDKRRIYEWLIEPLLTLKNSV